MNEPKGDAVPPGLADLPLEMRMARAVENDREIQEGLIRRHLAVAADESAYAAAQFARVLRIGPEIASKLQDG